MKEYSSVTQRWYEPDDCVFYRNGYQCAYMLSKPDCEVMDVFENNGKLVFAFPRELHKKYYKEWNDRKEDVYKTVGEHKWRNQ